MIIVRVVLRGVLPVRQHDVAPDFELHHASNDVQSSLRKNQLRYWIKLRAEGLMSTQSNPKLKLEIAVDTR